MKTGRHFLFLLFLSVVTFWAWPESQAQSPAKSPTQIDQPKLVIGRITASPHKHFSALDKMVKYLAGNIKSPEKISGEVLIARTYQQMATYLRTGEVHFVSETPFAALRFAQEIGAEILVLELKKGVAQYQTYFFARTDSEIKSIDNLAGKRIAFEDPGSTSAFLVPLAILKQRDYDMVRLENPRGAVPAGTVGYGFAEGEKNIASWVAMKVVDVGTVSNLDWEELARTPEKIKRDLQIIHKSSPILRSVIVVSPKLPLESKIQLKAALLKMHQDKVGKEILELYKVSEYRELSDEDTASLNATREMLELVRDEIK